MATLGIIHNPFAKGNLKRPRIGDKIRQAVEKVGFVRETRNVDELPEVAREFKEQGVDIMAVNGGDGTLHMALSAFIPVYGSDPLPKIMSLRGGTMNTMSNSLKIKGRTLSITKRAVKRLEAGEPFTEREQHLLKINDKYGFMSGAGIIANFLDVYYSGTGTGPWQAAKLISRAIAGLPVRSKFIKHLFRSAPLRVFAEGKKLDPEEYTIVLACTIRELGLGFTPTPRAYDRQDCFHLLVGTIRPHQVVVRLPQIWLGRDIAHHNLHFNSPVREAIVEPRERIRWMIDGEMYDSEEPLHYSVGPTVTVVTP
ncbi:MAG: diacylglycerol kinase family protein [bacterium]